MIHADEMATVWVVRAGDRDQLVQRFLDDGEIGIVMPDFPDGRAVDRTKALRILGVGMDDEPSKQQEAAAALFLSFVRRIAVGDLALLVDPAARGIVVGVVTGEYDYREELDDRQARHRRPVDWRRRLDDADLPDRLAHVPRQRSVLEDVADGRLRDLALQCSRGERGSDPFDRPKTAPPPARRPRASSGARRPKRPTPASRSAKLRSEQRCTFCLVTKPAELFDDDSDICRDCA